MNEQPKPNDDCKRRAWAFLRTAGQRNIVHQRMAPSKVCGGGFGITFRADYPFQGTNSHQMVYVEITNCGDDTILFADERTRKKNPGIRELKLFTLKENVDHMLEFARDSRAFFHKYFPLEVRS